MKPVYLLAGGRGSDRKKMVDIFRMILRESSRKLPQIAYIGTATDDNPDFFKMMTDSLLTAGAGRVNHVLLSPPHADLNKAKNILKLADIIYFGGGDVERGMQILTEKKMVGFLRQLSQQDKLFFGVSAGSIMLAQEWVRWRDPDDDSTVEIFPCLGIAPVICDTHAEEDDWQELKTLLLIKQEEAFGYGIPAGAAIKVLPDGTVQAFGGPVYYCRRQNGKIRREPDILPV